jgi:Na+/proline symporter
LWFLIGALPGVVAFGIVSPDTWWSVAVLSAVVVLMFVIMFTLLLLQDVMALDQPRPTPAQFRRALSNAILFSIFLVFVMAILVGLLILITR